MAHDADHALGKQPGTVRLCATRRDRRASFHRYACKRTRSWHHGSPETHGTTGCCIRSKSSRSTIHSFREGNTRTQFVFFSELARHAGYELDITQFAENRLLRTEFVHARFYNQSTTRTDRLEAVLNKALAETQPPSRLSDASELDDPVRAVRLAFPAPPTTTRGQSSSTPETTRPQEKSAKRKRGHEQD